MMQLFYSGTSPFVRKVTAQALETGLHDRIQRVPTDAWSDADPLPATNPVGRVPAMKLEDGEVLAGSQLICEYLDSLHEGRKFFPPAGPARWKALALQSLADGIMEAGVSSVVERLRRPEPYRWGAWVERQVAKVSRTLDALEAEAKAGSLAGPLTIGSLSVAIALEYVDLRLGDLKWRDSRPALAAWQAEVAQRPALAQTRPA